MNLSAMFSALLSALILGIFILLCTTSILNPLMWEAIRQGGDIVEILYLYTSFWGDILYLAIGYISLFGKSLLKLLYVTWNGIINADSLIDSVFSLNFLKAFKDLVDSIFLSADYLNTINFLTSNLKSIIELTFNRIFNNVYMGEVQNVINPILRWS